MDVMTLCSGIDLLLSLVKAMCVVVTRLPWYLNSTCDTLNHTNLLLRLLIVFTRLKTTENSKEAKNRYWTRVTVS